MPVNTHPTPHPRSSPSQVRDPHHDAPHFSGGSVTPEFIMMYAEVGRVLWVGLGYPRILLSYLEKYLWVRVEKSSDILRYIKSDIRTNR